MATMYTKNANGICEKICHEIVGELDTATRRIVQDTAHMDDTIRLFEIVPETPAEWEAWGTEIGPQGQRSRRVYDLGWWRG